MWSFSMRNDIKPWFDLYIFVCIILLYQENIVKLGKTYNVNLFKIYMWRNSLQKKRNVSFSFHIVHWRECIVQIFADLDTNSFDVTYSYVLVWYFKNISKFPELMTHLFMERHICAIRHYKSCSFHPHSLMGV